MTNEEKILEYFEVVDKSITSYEAFLTLEITRLSAVIYNLKAKGYTFNTERISTTNRRGERKNFARYTLTGAPNGK